MNKNQIIKKVLLFSLVIQSKQSECFLSYFKSAASAIKGTFNKENVTSVSLFAFNVIDRASEFTRAINETADSVMSKLAPNNIISGFSQLLLNTENTKKESSSISMRGIISSHIDNQSLIKTPVELTEEKISEYMNLGITQYNANFYQPLKIVQNQINTLNITLENLRNLCDKGFNKLVNSLDNEELTKLLASSDNSIKNQLILASLSEERFDEFEEVVIYSENKKLKDEVISVKSLLYNDTFDHLELVY